LKRKRALFIIPIAVAAITALLATGASALPQYTTQTGKACGYCHIRLENEKFKTAQGNPAKHFPPPRVGDSFKP